MIINTTITIVQLHSDLLKTSLNSFWNIKWHCLIHIKSCFSMFISLKNTLKIISVLSVVLLATFFLNPSVALASGFYSTCFNLKLDINENHANLTATCLNTNGQKVDSQLDLNKYIANHNGRIVWSPGEGGFVKTSAYNETSLEDKAVLFVSYPERDDGSLDRYGDEIDLNDYISNRNGVLVPDPLK